MLDSRKTFNKEDFDPLSLVAPIDAATKDISKLTARIKAIEDKFGSPTLIATTLLEASKEAVKMSEMFETGFLNQISKNEPIRNAIKEIIKSEDRNFVATQIKKWQMWVAAAFLFIIAQVSSRLNCSFTKDHKPS